MRLPGTPSPQHGFGEPGIASVGSWPPPSLQLRLSPGAPPSPHHPLTLFPVSKWDQVWDGLSLRKLPLWPRAPASPCFWRPRSGLCLAAGLPGPLQLQPPTAGIQLSADPGRPGRHGLSSAARKRNSAAKLAVEPPGNASPLMSRRHRKDCNGHGEFPLCGLQPVAVVACCRVGGWVRRNRGHLPNANANGARPCSCSLAAIY